MAERTVGLADTTGLVLIDVLRGAERAYAAGWIGWVVGARQRRIDVAGKHLVITAVIDVGDRGIAPGFELVLERHGWS